MTKKKTPQTIEECNAELERTQKKIRQYENRSKMLDRRLAPVLASADYGIDFYNEVVRTVVLVDVNRSGFRLVLDD